MDLTFTNNIKYKCSITFGKSKTLLEGVFLSVSEIPHPMQLMFIAFTKDVSL